MSNATTVEASNFDLPDIGEWESKSTMVDGMEVIHFDGTYNPRTMISGPGDSIQGAFAGYVLNGLEEWKENTEEVTELKTPKTFSDIDEDDYYINEVGISSDSINRDRDNEFNAWGIPASQLEAALRFVTSGSEYDPSEITIEVVGFRLVVSNNEDTYIFGNCRFTYPFEDYTETTEVNGIEIENETNEEVINGIESIAEFLELINIGITGYSERRVCTHVFTTETGKELEMGSYAPRTITGGINKDPLYNGEADIESEVTGKRYKFNIQREELDYDVGEIIDSPESVVRKNKDHPGVVSSEEAIGIIAGYHTHIDNKSRCLRVNPKILIVAPRSDGFRSQKEDTLVVEMRRGEKKTLRELDPDIEESRQADQ